MSENAIITDLLGIAVEPTYFDLEHHQLDPSEVIKDIKDVGANTIRIGMFSHQGHTYYPSKIAPESPFLNGRNLLKEFEAECRKQDIRFVVYLNSKWVTGLAREHPDWIVRLNGKPFEHCGKGASLVIHPMCPSSPFIEYFKKIIREVLTISLPDALYIDNFAIEPFCECSYCRKNFGRKTPDRKHWNSPQTQRYLKWLPAESQKIAEGIVSTVRNESPKTPVVFNRGQFYSEVIPFSPEDNYQYAHKIANAIHTESAVRLYGNSFEHINEQCTFGRSIDLPVWTWVEYPMLPFSYIAPSKDEAKIKAAKVLANGGRPMVWSMACAPLVCQKGFPGIKEVFELASKNKECFDNVSFKQFAGIVFSSKSLRLYCQGDRDRLKEYKKTFSGAYNLMIRNHVPCDFLLDVTIHRKYS